MKQLPLELPDAPPRRDRNSFVRSDANAIAWRAGQAWLGSLESALVICGPSGAGKTHFAHALLNGAPARFTTADTFSAGEGLIVIDDMPPTDARGFLTAFETAIGAGARLILIGQGHPSGWSGGLKDLRTRIEAAPRAVFAEPDETLIRAVIAKGFRDRQIAVAPNVVEFAAPRLPRTFAAAHRFVALADRAALAEKRAISLPFAQKLIDNLSEGDPAA